MKKIRLTTRNKIALIDDSDYELVSKYKWYSLKGKNGVFYAATHPKKHEKVILMHRYILGINDPKIQVDHKDSNGLNNQRTNIRLATHAQNCQNSRIGSDNRTSNYKGVNIRKNGIIRATIRNKHLGNFANEIDAALAYNKEAIKLYGEFANLNKI